MGVIVANNGSWVEVPWETHTDKEQLLELNDDQVEDVIAAHHDNGNHLPRCTMTLRWPPEEPVCEPWP